MEATEVIVNLGIFVATVLAAIIAWRSVRDAQLARDEAQAAQLSASDAAQRSADADERIAIALEKSAETAAQLAESDTWRLEKGHSSNVSKWSFINTSRASIELLDVFFIPSTAAYITNKPDLVGTGQSFTVSVRSKRGEQVCVGLRWRDASGVALTQRYSIY